MKDFLKKIETRHILMPFSLGLAIIISSILSAFSFPSAYAFTYDIGLIFTANPTTISSGSASTLEWEAYYIDVLPSPEPSLTCTASGAWSGSKVLEGSQSTGSLTSSKTYTLTCVSQAGTSITKSVIVTVGSTQHYTLTTAINPVGSGTITSSPGGINCPSDCSQNYTSGTQVTLTAIPLAGYAFLSWSGACPSQDNPCTIYMSVNKSTTANFTTAPAPTLSIIASANPSSGTAPLNDVDITGNVSGTATGGIVYKMDCTNDGTWEHTSSSITTDPYTVANLCDYSSAGTYTVKVQATRQGITASDTATVTVTSAPPPPPPPPTSTDNPVLPSSCGIDIALVLDSSGSIDSTELGQMKNAFKSFVNIFLPTTPTLFSVTEFDSSSNVLQTFTDDISLLNSAISTPVSGGATNWEDGLKKARATFDPRSGSEHPNLVIFASDGNPTVNNGTGGNSTTGTTDSNDLINAITVANSIKDSGTRIIALGIGNHLNVENLEAISSADAVYTSSFDTLATDLADIATELCGGTITIKKLVDTDGNLNTTDDQFPASGWAFGIKGEPTNPGLKLTGIDGFTPSVEVEPGTYTIAEEMEEGYKLIDAKCTINNSPVGTLTETGVAGISVGASDIVSCVFINHENHIPVITLNAPNPDKILVNDGPYVDPGYLALDLEDGDITAEVVIGGDTVDTTTPGIYFITYNVVDSDGAPAVQKTRTVNVSALPPQCSDGLDNDGDSFIDYPDDSGCIDGDDDDENTPPVITAESVLILTLGSIFNALDHATVEDAEDDPEPALIVGGDTVLTSAIGDYSVTYDATDSDGATAIQKILLVKVRAQCSDSIDNDVDQFIDSTDPGCHSDADPNNQDSYDPNDDDETNPNDVCNNLEGIQLVVPNGLVSVNGECVPPSPVCSDGIDNDEDNLIDSADPGCHSDADPNNPDSYEPNDEDETDQADICANLDGIQLTAPDGLIRDGDNCVAPEPDVVSVSLTANPETIDKGQNSELSWISSNATACSADWTSATSTSGVATTSPESTTTYSITCGNGTATSTDEATVTVNSPGVTVSLSADPETIDKGQNSTLSWTSSNTTTCEAGWTSATSTAGSQVVSPESTTVYSLTCGNGTATSTDTTTVTVNTPTITPPPSSGGGGGSSRSGSTNSGGGGTVLGASIAPTTCFYLRDYMRIDFDNDPMEVLKLQAFLINFEGHTNVSLTGVFDQATFDAVSSFQMKYFKDILEPWGHTGPTGYVYILTKKKINEIYCQTIYPLTQEQINEIVSFKAFLTSLRAQGINPELSDPGVGESVIVPETETLVTLENMDESTTTVTTITIVDNTDVTSKGQNIGALAAAIFAPPETLIDAFKCLYEWLIILIILYVIGSVLKNVLYKNFPENTRKRFVAKWITIDIGLVVSIVIAYIFGWWCLIFPLFVALLFALLWTLTYNKHNSMRASVKSWYLVTSARMKSKPVEEKISDKEFFKKEIPPNDELPKETVKKETPSRVIEMGPKK